MVKDLKHKVLDKRITIQKLTSAPGPNGFPEDAWTDHKTVWASANNLYGKEYFAAKAVQSETTVNFLIRYLADIDATITTEGLQTTEVFRIRFRNLFFDIVFIDNVKYGREFMNIKALAVV